MPQRKAVGRELETDGVIREETGTSPAAMKSNETIPKSAIPIRGPLSLEEEERVPLAPQVDSRKIDDLHMRRLTKWKESPFAAGLTEVSWDDERTRDSHKSKFDHELERDMTGCLCCSALVCPMLGAERVGNMSVLKSTMETMELVEVDEETGNERVTRYQRPHLQIVVGPYWPMLAFVTYPLIFLVSGLALKEIVNHNKSPILAIVWFVLTTTLVVSLACTSCSDPGIMYRVKNPPPQEEALWRWSEKALTYRPRHARYDTDTAVVVRQFDHTCPWTGTAIGEGNMLPFQTFVCLIFICLILDIFIITDTM